MKDHATRLFTDESLIRATHWAVFTLGALSLTISVCGTLYTAFFA